jgi:2-polyprenyl-6-methoxyphenol hydroxylase-like FAD-dependent oxidoreductase
MQKALPARRRRCLLVYALVAFSRKYGYADNVKSNTMDVHRAALWGDPAQAFPPKT